MANVIIPIEHQSAPKDVKVTSADIHAAEEWRRQHRRAPSDLASWEKYDTEMDLPADNPLLQAELRQLEQRDRVERRSGDAMIEELLRQHEESEMVSKGQRWEGQQRWQGRENEEMRLVNILHPYSFLRKLQRAGIDARPEESKYARLWLNSWSKLGRIGVNAWIYKHGRMVAETVTSLQYPYSPEFSIMRFNQYNVPTNERYRGWRTTLLALITADVLTEGEADRAFGPCLGIAGEFYRQQLFNHRRFTLGLDRF